MTHLSRVWTTLADCRSPADFYRLQIGFQQFATPAEVARLAESTFAWPPEFGAWLRKLGAAVIDTCADIQPYRLKPLGEAISLYTADAGARTLVIGFCGKAGLLFMPIPIVLQHFASRECDVLVLRDPAKIGFVAGIAGHSRSFDELIGRLRLDLDFSAYEDVRTFGTSGGGAAALAAGILLGTPGAVSFSGRLPSASPQYGTHPHSGALEAILRRSGPLRNYACVYGEKNASDAANAIALQRSVGSRLVPIAGVSNHNVIYGLQQSGELRALFKDVGLL